VTLDVGFCVSQTLLQNQSTKTLSVAVLIRIAHPIRIAQLVRTAAARPQPLLSLSARRHFRRPPHRSTWKQSLNCRLTFKTSAAPNAARQSIPRSTITYDVGVSTLFCQATVTAKT
jgi:hypothetical protein